MVTVFDCPGLPPLILHEISNQKLDGGEGLATRKGSKSLQNSSVLSSQN